MPGQRLHSFREGDRSEIVARYLLSAVASAVPVPREEDFGLDLLCALLHRDEHLLRVGKSFGVQVKSGSSANDLTLGGATKDGAWKGWEVEWLYGQDVPLFVGLVDPHDWTLELYSVQKCWWVMWMRHRPYEIKLRPGEPSPYNPYTATELASSDVVPAVAGTHDGKAWEVPLGKPVVRIDRSVERDADLRASVADTLDRWIYVDRLNIYHRHLGIPAMFEFEHWVTNKAPQYDPKGTRFWSDAPDQNVREILRAISPGVASLYHKFKKEGDQDRVDALDGIVELAEEFGVLDDTIKRPLKS